MEILLRLSIYNVSGLESPGDWIDHFYTLGFWIPFMYLLNYQETFFSHQAQPPLKIGFRSHLCPKPPSSFHSTPIYGERSPSDYLRTLPGPQGCLPSEFVSECPHSHVVRDKSKNAGHKSGPQLSLWFRHCENVTRHVLGQFPPILQQSTKHGSWCLASTFNILRGLGPGQCRDWSLDTL